MTFAPIVLFGFIRKDTIEKVINGLLSNPEARLSDLFIFIDGPRSDTEKELVESVYDFCCKVAGFKSVTIEKSDINRGLDPSILRGVSKIIEIYDMAIVLEDDVVPTSNFLAYMNQALRVYKDDTRIMSISAFGLKVFEPTDYNYDVYMFGRSTSWGWGTWKDRWIDIDWQINDWDSFRKDKNSIKEFCKRGGDDLFDMLSKCMQGGGMWDIRFTYNMFKKNKYTIMPFVSKTHTIGFNSLAVHCKPVKFNRFKYVIDSGETRDFKMPSNICIEKRIIRSRLLYQKNIIRIIYKILNIFS